jgi:hypothetical protein
VRIAQLTLHCRGSRLQYLIEARELTNETTHHPTFDTSPQRTTVEASDADEAISQYVREGELELVSFIKPRGRESIATVRKDDAVYLVRVYAA